jgi:hypothetical protein
VLLLIALIYQEIVNNYKEETYEPATSAMDNLTGPVCHPFPYTLPHTRRESLGNRICIANAKALTQEQETPAKEFLRPSITLAHDLSMVRC